MANRKAEQPKDKPVCVRLTQAEALEAKANAIRAGFTRPAEWYRWCITVAGPSVRDGKTPAIPTPGKPEENVATGRTRGGKGNDEARPKRSCKVFTYA